MNLLGAILGFARDAQVILSLIFGRVWSKSEILTTVVGAAVIKSAAVSSNIIMMLTCFSSIRGKCPSEDLFGAFI